MHHEKRIAKRANFDPPFGDVAVAVAADGTWSVKGRLEDISATGGKFRILSEFNARMRSEEFFLVITPDGRVKRRSKLVWEKAPWIGIKFVASKTVSFV